MAHLSSVPPLFGTLSSSVPAKDHKPSSRAPRRIGVGHELIMGPGLKKATATLLDSSALAKKESRLEFYHLRSSLLGLSQSGLAQKLDISVDSVSRYENGKSTIPAWVMRRMHSLAFAADRTAAMKLMLSRGAGA